jgi:hypothetical protein
MNKVALANFKGLSQEEQRLKSLKISAPHEDPSSDAALS